MWIAINQPMECEICFAFSLSGRVLSFSSSPLSLLDGLACLCFFFAGTRVFAVFGSLAVELTKQQTRIRRRSEKRGSGMSWPQHMIRSASTHGNCEPSVSWAVRHSKALARSCAQAYFGPAEIRVQSVDFCNYRSRLMFANSTARCLPSSASIDSIKGFQRSSRDDAD